MLKNQMSEPTYLYGHQVGQVMTTNLLSSESRIHMLLTPLQLVLVLQYLANPPFTVLSSSVTKHDRSFLLHLLEPAVNRCLYADLWNVGVQYRCSRFWSSSDISSSTDVIKWL